MRNRVKLGEKIHTAVKTLISAIQMPIELHLISISTHLGNTHSLVTNLTDTDNADIMNASSKGNNDAPICPKPRRLGSAMPVQFLINNYPFQCNKNHQVSCDGRSGILDIISDKRMDGIEEEISSTRCGSPPGRTDNALVHDVHFLQIHHHMNIFPPFAPT